MVKDLEQQVEDLQQKLAGNDEFVSAAQYATEIALRSHHAEKLEALKNGLRNIASSAGDETRRSVFLRYIDELTPRHLEVLDFADRNLEIRNELQERQRQSRVSQDWTISDMWDEGHRGGPSWVHDGLLGFVIKDLHRRELLHEFFLNASRPAAGFVTKLGTQFLEFIRNSDDDVREGESA